MSKKYFSVEEAEEILPEVERKIIKLSELNEKIKLLHGVKIDSSADGIENALAIAELNKNIHFVSFEFFREMEELISLGCIVKDVEKGGVDFYSKLGERDIFLCWKLGETKIQFWHEIEKERALRQPIEIVKKEYEKQLEQFR